MEVRKRRSVVSKNSNRIVDARLSALQAQENKTNLFSSDDSSKDDRATKLGKVNFVTTDLKKFKILIVDDERNLRDAIVFDFKRKGLTVLQKMG